MVCIYCGSDTQVINSRPQKRSNTIWRRRRCIMCDVVFSSTETADYSKSIVVRGKDAHQLAPFERDRLFISLHKSLGHRPSAQQDASALSATIITKLLRNAHNGELSRQLIIQTTIVALHRFDALAAQHYQAFHKL